jgi:rhamnogalacturonan endolyase
VTGSGGVIDSGGAPDTGGSISSNPDASPDLGTDAPVAIGGDASTGGVTSSGGTISSGGIIASSGITGSGGVTSSGGIISSGGVSNSGGIAGSGGVASSGGVIIAGGTTSPGSATATGGQPTGHYQMENLDRGAVAVVVTGGIYVGWRMFGYEYDPTASNVAYNVYRDGSKLATVTDSTNYLDASGTASSSYAVTAVIKGIEGPQSPAVTPWAQNYLSIPLQPPAPSPQGYPYIASDGSPGDLDGDGQYDIVLKWDPSAGETESSVALASYVLLDGYTLAGRRLWRIDLGPNIVSGPHYTQFSVYDFDGDGKAEVACKTAPGTKDGTGAYLSTGPAATDDDSAVYRNSSGYVLTGPEYFTVFDGTTGKELATVDYPVLRGTVSSWGDAYGNRVDRFNGGVAFVKDGGVATGLPSIIQGRGYYTRVTVSALTFRNGVLANNWIYDSVTSFTDSTGAAIGGGDHSEMAADTDGDGGQEIVTGPLTIDSAGTLKCNSGMGHGDAMDVGELVPGKGISVFSIHESVGGMDVHDGATCRSYFAITSPGVDTGRGRAEYVGSGDENGASCTAAAMNSVLCADGTTSAPSAGTNFVIYWDADEWRELEDATSITKAGGGTLLTATGCSGNNGTKNTPTLTADLLGDWREEIAWRESLNTALRVYTTTDVTKRRIYTLMHDPTYRAQVAFEQSGYNQPPHTGFRISPNMADPPKPDIHVK